MSSQTPTLSDVVAHLERRYPPATAESWDAVGLVTGDPAQPVRKVLFAVDAVAAVAEEAVEWGADLVVVHHPLLLRGVHSIAADEPKGALLHRLVRAGCALYAAHTNADSATRGVADALADVLGVVDTRPLVPAPAGGDLDKHVVLVPEEDADRIIDALSRAGAGAIGDYERCAWTTTGTGTFVPLDGADPAIGTVGEVAQVRETRVEMVAPRHLRSAVVAAMRAAHPYEEPAFDVLELAPPATSTGLGRLGRLEAPTTLRAFAERVAQVLPATPQGVRVAGDLDAEVETVAVLGGSGDSEIASARAAGADVYVTSDLKHHPVSDARELDTLRGDGRPFLVDTAHFASEWPWLRYAAEDLASDVAGAGGEIEVRVSTLRTDPWTARFASPDRD
ncbi:dinuclear metal center YbgI/SA1388 family protein [Flavimobilis soli]|uniref:GTP cyclohydrolase 1 type 2 homolog n=1 Tax=Flavimobilis soli TaxID=442709 RepID=A0A2A9E978_9MICO|nr:Nif3-like dinuclear metal center hexameric protein [Flavimobilis soli]PFG35414.1 dinuclear metal center YbgI/SA1388 family protein [Flavimobilis soli]